MTRVVEQKRKQKDDLSVYVPRYYSESLLTS